MLSYWLFCIGILIAYYASMNVWLFWAIENLYAVIAAFFLILSMLLANSMNRSLFSRRDFLFPIVSCSVILFYQLLVNNSVFNSYLLVFFRLFIFFLLFRLNKEYLPKLSTFLCKSMACLMLISLPAFLLYMFGFPFPGRNAQWHDLYFFTNHYLFLVSDGAINQIFQRFHSVFLEPGHLGTAIVLLLATQCGKWKQWYNVVNIVALLSTFSLAAYGLFVIVIFMHMWIQRKNIVMKIFFVVVLISAVVGGSFVYNGGDNMLNQLILARLEVNDTGDDIEGNNRVSANFEAEFNSYMESSDVFFGREMDKSTFGNAGYRVYIYENGIVGFFLVYLFYFISLKGGTDKRAFIAAIVLSLANFWIRAYPFWYGFYIPYYLMAYMDITNMIPAKAELKREMPK